MRRTRRRRGQAPITDIPLTPLIDTALTLLIIFMVTAPMIQNAIRVELPKGTIKEDADAKQDLVVYVDKDNQIFLNNTQITLDVLAASISELVQGSPDTVIFVKADQSVAYGRVIELVDQIKGIDGVRYVALATQKRV